MRSGWNWRRTREGRRRGWTFLSFGSFGVAVPWITLALLLVLLWMASGVLTSAEGVFFDLPEQGLAEGETTDLVALALAMPKGTLVYFDDARYSLDDGVSAGALRERFAERVRETRRQTLLVLADRNVSTGDLMNLATLARLGGVKRVLFANKRTEARNE